ncbi:hypothetical protein R1sor_017343 [Riccia sorocarpa]|uniref:Glutamine amidotransferase type-2 domain-containing protein n=1 Tax=Riccia sorocarpa TaxID=122646 RepID=A0ABD3I6Z2_9MARC
MCGIGLILAGVAIDGQFSPDDAEVSGFCCNPEVKATEQILRPSPTYEELCSILSRRGPDGIGGRNLYLSPERQYLEKVEVEIISDESYGSAGSGRVRYSSVSSGSSSSPRNFITSVENAFDHSAGSNAAHGGECNSSFQFIGSTLQLRGDHPVQQPLVDSEGNVLVYNGEMFGGLEVMPCDNDTEVLMEALRNCCSCSCHGRRAPVPLECECNDPSSSSSATGCRLTVPQLLSQLRGPWALIYWQAGSRTLWFGRDAIGRRSLLIHKPTKEDPRLLLTSAAPELVKPETTAAASTGSQRSPGHHVSSSDRDTEERDGPATATATATATASVFWEELTCKIHSISYQAEVGDEPLRALACVHEWQDPTLRKLLAWERNFVNPNTEQAHLSQTAVVDRGSPADRVLQALCEAVKRRTANIKRPSSSSQQLESTASFPVWNGRSSHNGAPVAVLFSGGVDSMILAAIADQFVDPSACIDLLNVSFEGNLAPDRITALSGLRELKEVFPLRRWRLIKIDATLSDMQRFRGHLLSLLCPSNTYMDINIGTALWLAATGKGYVHEDSSQEVEPELTETQARVLLVGSGADEQCGGYGRHRTKFRQGGWETLECEMKMDFNRIWKRNLGRDDRCLSDQGREARFPFLDEDVVSTLLSLPLWEVVNMEEPAGYGEKKILRQVARLLGLYNASSLPKRAIQFGSRIARESNRKDFGSNRAANLANAGTIVLKEFVSSNQQVNLETR